MNKDVVVIYDGQCGFCNQSVLFIIKRDKKSITSFSANTSNFSKEQFRKYGLEDISKDTLVLIEGGAAYTFSDAAIKISKYLTFPWNIFHIFRVLPKRVRDSIYNLIAKNRYKLLGNKNVCEIPGDDVLKRFIED